MAFQTVLTKRHAAMVVEGLESGKIKDPEDVAAAKEVLREYIAQTDARTEFAEKLDLAPKPPPQGLAFKPKQFASPEAEKQFLESSGLGPAARAAEMGIDVTTGVDPDIRLKAELLGFNEGVSALAMEELVRLKYKDEIPPGIPAMVHVDGLPAALQKGEDGKFRYVAVDPVGFDAGDIKAALPDAAQILAETAGGIGGAVAGGLAGPATAVVGSAIGAGAFAGMSIQARVALAKELGVPDTVIEKVAVDEESMQEAMLAFGGDILTAGFLSLVRGGTNLLQGRVLSPDDVKLVWNKTLETLDIAKEFKKRTGRDLPLNLAQVTGDLEMAQTVALAKQRAKGKVSRQIAADEALQDNITAATLRDFTEQRIITPADEIKSVQEVTEKITRKIQKPLRKSQKAVAQEEERLADFESDMRASLGDDANFSPDAFIRVRDNIDTIKTKVAEAEQAAWESFRKEVEFDPEQGSNLAFVSAGEEAPIKQVLLRLDADAERELLESQRKATKKFVQDAGLPEEGPTRGLAGEFLDPRELHFTRSDLLRKIRNLEKGTDPDKIRARNLKDVVEAIDETIRKAPMIRRSNGKAVPDEKVDSVREAFFTASDLTVKRHSLYEGDTLTKLLQVNPRTGEPTAPAGFIRKHLFAPGDARVLQEAMTATDQNPNIRAALAREFEKHMRNSVGNDPDGSRFRTFLDEYSDHIEVLGLPASKIRGPGSLRAAVKQATDNANAVQARLQREFGKRLGDDTADVVNIVEELRKLSQPRVKNVIRFLQRKDPKLHAALKDHSLVTVRRELASGGDTSLNFDELWKLLDTQEATLRALHGQKYVNDLRLLKRTQQVLNRTRLGKGAPSADAQSAFVDATRTIFGPLSREQRMISSSQRIRRRLLARSGRKIISTPEDLAALISFRNRTTQDVIRDQTISRELRFLLFGDEFDGDARNEALSERSAPASAAVQRLRTLASEPL